MELIQAVAQIFFDDRVPSTALRLYGMLRTNPKLTKPELAEATKRTERAVADNIDILEQLGYVIIHLTRALGVVEVSYSFPDNPPQIITLQKAS